MSIGRRRTEASELSRARDRLSFVYVERCVVHRDDNAVTATDRDGVIHIPVATLGCLMLGPGTSISYAAMALLGDSGASVVWVGENGVRFYAGGRPLARSTALLQAQARLVSSVRTRLDVARTMYAWRFPGEDVSGLTMQQLRGREGARVRALYRAEAARTGVPWSRRQYDPADFEDSDVVNRALTAGNASLYGVVHAVIVALGCAPGLGFVHTGNDRSFVYDMADLYKAEVTIPAAFEAAAADAGGGDVGPVVRRLVRDRVVQTHLLERIARDVQVLLQQEQEAEWEQDEDLSLWAGQGDETVPGGVSYEEAP